MTERLRAGGEGRRMRGGAAREWQQRGRGRGPPRRQGAAAAAGEAGRRWHGSERGGAGEGGCRLAGEGSVSRRGACMLLAITRSLAAGCWTSSSPTMVAASFVTKSFSRWLMTILFIPLGPREVRTHEESCFAASMFLKVASSSPLRCLVPSLSMPCTPKEPPVNERAILLAVCNAGVGCCRVAGCSRPTARAEFFCLDCRGNSQ